MCGADAALTWLTRTRHGGGSVEVEGDVDGGEGGGAQEPMVSANGGESPAAGGTGR